MTKPKTKLIQMPAQELCIHPTAQRELRPARVTELAENLDLDAIGVMHAVEYPIDDVVAKRLVDGQHRWQALIDRELGEWIVNVLLHLDVKDDARASDLFLKLNNRAAIYPFDKFKNAHKAGYEHAVGVTDIAEAHRLKVHRQVADGHIACVSALSRVWKYDQGATLDAVLGTVTEAWGRTASSCEAKLIEGIGLVFKTFNGVIDRPAMAKKLAKYPGGAPALMGDARGLREYRKASVARCVTERVIETYNAGRRSGRLDPL
jgi:hypothetical protein